MHSSMESISVVIACFGSSAHHVLENDNRSPSTGSVQEATHSQKVTSFLRLKITVCPSQASCRRPSFLPLADRQQWTSSPPSTSTSCRSSRPGRLTRPYRRRSSPILIFGWDLTHAVIAPNLFSLPMTKVARRNRRPVPSHATARDANGWPIAAPNAGRRMHLSATTKMVAVVTDQLFVHSCDCATRTRPLMKAMLITRRAPMRTRKPGIEFGANSSPTRRRWSMC